MHLYLIWCLPDHSNQPEALHHKSKKSRKKKQQKKTHTHTQPEGITNKQGRH